MDGISKFKTEPFVIIEKDETLVIEVEDNLYGNFFTEKLDKRGRFKQKTYFLFKKSALGWLHKK
jgi:hypothetical protein